MYIVTMYRNPATPIPSVVMLYDQPVHDIFFDPANDFWQSLRAICSRTPLDPQLHCRRILVSATTLHLPALEDRALCEWYEADVVVSKGEVECPEARETTLIRRGLHDTVYCAFVESPRKHLESVAGVDDLHTGCDSVYGGVRGDVSVQERYPCA